MKRKRLLRTIGLALLGIIIAVVAFFIWSALAFSHFSPQEAIPKDNRVFGGELDISWDTNRNDVRIRGVAWQQRTSSLVTEFFTVLAEPREQLVFSVLVENVGHEPLEARWVDLALFDFSSVIGGYQVSEGYWSNQLSTLILPGEMRPMWGGSVFFPEDLDASLNWSSGHISMDFESAGPKTSCKVKRWSLQNATITRTELNWFGDYIIEGRVFDIYPFKNENKYFSPSIYLSFYNESGEYIGFFNIPIKKDGDFRVRLDNSEYSFLDEIASYEVHFIEAETINNICP